MCRVNTTSNVSFSKVDRDFWWVHRCVTVISRDSVILRDYNLKEENASAFYIFNGLESMMRESLQWNHRRMSIENAFSLILCILQIFLSLLASLPRLSVKRVPLGWNAWNVSSESQINHFSFLSLPYATETGKRKDRMLTVRKTSCGTSQIL